jgi:hypothetical protein
MIYRRERTNVIKDVVPLPWTLTSLVRCEDQSLPLPQRGTVYLEMGVERPFHKRQETSWFQAGLVGDPPDDWENAMDPGSRDWVLGIRMRIALIRGSDVYAHIRYVPRGEWEGKRVGRHPG